MKTYKVIRTTTMLLDKGKPTEHRKVVRDVVANGLTWAHAKAMQQADRSLSIVAERAARQEETHEQTVTDAG